MTRQSAGTRGGPTNGTRERWGRSLKATLPEEFAIVPTRHFNGHSTASRACKRGGNRRGDSLSDRLGYFQKLKKDGVVEEIRGSEDGFFVKWKLLSLGE